VFHWLNTARSAACDRAGPLLLRVGRGPWVGNLLMVAMAALQAGASFYFGTATPLRDDLPYGFTLMMYLAADLNLLVFLSVVGFCINWWRFGLEAREHGLLLGRARFVPWSDVVDCKWWRPKRLRIQVCFRLPIQWRVCKDVASLTAALGRFVPVYDAAGTVLAKPAEGERPADAPPRRISRRHLLQFDIQSMLLLTVVVACGASCYSIRYHRLKPQWEAVARHADAIARLRALGPQMQFIGDGVYELNFSGCKIGPTDDDLVHLEQLVELHHVNLAGAAVTDAGLIHLKGLTKLRWLDLTDTAVTDAGLTHLTGLKELIRVDLTRTRVTSAGVAELRRSAPGAFITSSRASRTVPPPRVQQRQ
jgi:hypothetical protein